MHSAAGVEGFDEVILACHSDQALALLRDADPVERDVLGAIRYQANEAVLHTDASLLPRNRKAWAAWNAHVPKEPGAPCTVSYCMNLLQGLPGDTAGRDPQPQRGDRSGQGAAQAALCPSGPRPRSGTRATALG